MKTLRYIVEDKEGKVTGAIVENNGREETIQVDTPFPRAELASRAVSLCAQHGIALPQNPAIQAP